MCLVAIKFYVKTSHYSTFICLDRKSPHFVFLETKANYQLKQSNEHLNILEVERLTLF